MMIRAGDGNWKRYVFQLPDGWNQVPEEPGFQSTPVG